MFCTNRWDFRSYRHPLKTQRREVARILARPAAAPAHPRVVVGLTQVQVRQVAIGIGIEDHDGTRKKSYMSPIILPDPFLIAIL